jgi:hypothetical protein
MECSFEKKCAAVTAAATEGSLLAIVDFDFTLTKYWSEDGTHKLCSCHKVAPD